MLVLKGPGVTDRQRRIDGLRRCLHSLGDVSQRQRRLHEQHGRSDTKVRAAEREVEEQFRIPRHVAPVDVRSDANDGQLVLRTRGCPWNDDELADGIGVAEQPARQLLADNGRGRRAGRQRLRVREVAALDDAHAEHIEVRGAHRVGVHLDGITLATGGIMQPHRSSRTERREGADRERLESWCAVKPLHDGSVIDRGAIRSIAVAARIHPVRRHAGWLESQVDRVEVPERRDQHERAGDQCQRQGELHDREGCAQPACAGDRSPSGIAGCTHRRPGAQQGRH